MSDGRESQDRGERELLERAMRVRPTEREQFVREQARDDHELAARVLRLLHGEPEGANTDAIGRTQQLAERAMDVPASEREAFVRREVVDDPEYLERVLRLLEQTADVEAMFDAYAEYDELPDRVGSYRILEVLGEGGMGRVYRAERNQPVRQEVALKLIKLGMDSVAVVRRFEQERQALALMNHEGIAKVFDCGTSERGQPFFVMELVQGVPLDEFCERHRLSLQDRLLLMKEVCAAVQHAHHKGVVHRDLKPSNVLVSGDGDRRQVKIIDFGLAKAMGPKLVEATLFTEAGQIVGTPEYMAPEQAHPSNRDIDTRVDIYSLGVMLYEVLVGELPFPGTELRKAGILEIQRILREVEPAKPSTKLTAMGEASTELARSRRVSVGALKRALKTDLDWVVLKALEKDRNRRYDNANALAADLQRFLDHEPLLAGPPSTGYRLKKLCRRYRGRLAAAALVFLALVVGGVGTLLEYRRAERKAEENAALAREKGALAEEKTELAGELAETVHEFTQLAAVETCQQLIEDEAGLHPAWPRNVQRMEGWISNCDALLAARDEVQGTVDSLRRRALPLTDEQRRLDFETHPRNGEWRRYGQYVRFLRRAQDIRDGTLAFSEIALPRAHREAGMLEVQAYNRAAPFFQRYRIYGEEELGLAYARAAVARTEPRQNIPALMTLAWALLANGQDAAAIAQARQAVEYAGDAEKEKWSRVCRSVEQHSERAAEKLAGAEARLRTLTAELESRRSWSFGEASRDQEFLHDALTKLLRDMTVLENEHRVSVAARLRWASSIEELSLAHPQASMTWDEARRAIAASDRYDGCEIALPDEHVMGLVPMGPNPITGYLEFYHLRSAWDGASDPAEIPIPVHGDDGSVAIDGDTGIVFVLLPGGEFRMGATRDPSAENHDPQALPRESPPHVLRLDPFFLARHEITQGQWRRLWLGDDAFALPSSYHSKTVVPGVTVDLSEANPVEQISWKWCREFEGWHGLSMPTEARWEYACRAGSATPWYCRFDELRLYENVSDSRTAKQWGWKCDSWEDEYMIHAPVGSLRANAFGLYDMHANVAEWCLDEWGEYLGPTRAGDGLRLRGSHQSKFVVRGGSYALPSHDARSAARGNQTPESRTNWIGARLARSLRH